MPELLLTPVAIGYLADFLLLGLTVAYFWNSTRRRAASPAEKAFQRAFLSFSIFALCGLGEEATTQPWNLYFHYALNVVVAVSQLFCLRFVYLFPRSDSRHAREGRVVVVLNLAMVVVESVFLVHRFQALWTAGRVIWRPLWAEGMVSLQFLWMVAVLLRKAASESAAAGDTRFWPARAVTPRGQRGRAALQFALVMSLLAGVALASGLPLPQDVLGLTVSLGTLVGSYLVVLIYLNSTASSVSLRVKLVGVALASILALVTIMNWTVVSLYLRERSIDRGLGISPLRPMVAGNQSLRFKPDSHGGYQLEGVEPLFDDAAGRRLEVAMDAGSAVELPFQFVYFGRPWARLWVSLNGFVSFGPEMPHLSDYSYRYGSKPAILAGLAMFREAVKEDPGGVFYAADNEHATITWRRLKLANDPAGLSTFQVVLRRDGTIELNYRAIQAGTMSRFARSATEAWLVGLLPGGARQIPSQRIFADGVADLEMETGPEGVVQDNLLEWRRVLHPVSLRMSLLTLLVSLAVFFGFPLVIKALLIQPLDRLVAGVSKVNAGDLEVRVVPPHPDEIGYLTESFNRMVESIRVASAELSRHRDNLEGLVRARTEALEREIGAKELMAGELVRAKKAAEAASQAKSAFLASVSHEIRTPMNGVVGMTSLLLQTPLSNEQRHYSETIRHSSEALLRIVNDILDISKIEAGRLDLEETRFELRSCFDESVELLSPRAAQKRLELTCRVDDSLPEMAVGDAPRLRQIMLNLLGNALKFTDKGEIEVTATRVASRSLAAGAAGAFQIECCVRDTGVGIPAEAIGRLFQPFTQVDTSTKRKFGGTGLGLAISKRLVEAMGGRIWAESPSTGGGCFRFVVTLKKAEPEPPAWTRAAAALAGKRFLVISPHVATSEMLVHYIELWGASAVVCSTLAAAVSLMNSHPNWDAVLLDEGAWEGGAGLSATEDFTARLTEKRIPLACMFRADPEADRATPTPAGSRVMRKPVRPAKLLDDLRELVGRGSSAPGPPSASIEVLPVTAASFRVLVADDNEVNQKVVTAYLKLLGCQTWVAGNGKEVLDAVAKQPFDLVLMDVQMPEMDGLEAARELGKRFSPADMPLIIGLSAGVSQIEREACFAAGMVDFLAKPLRLADLKAGLDRWREWFAEGLKGKEE